MMLREILKSSFEDVYQDLKTVTDPSFWRRIFKALDTSFLDVLKPKLDALFKMAKLCLQHVFIAVLKTSLEDWSLRRVWSLKTLTDPSFWRRIFKTLKTSFLDVLKPKPGALSKTGIQVVLKSTIFGFSERPHIAWILFAIRLHIRPETSLEDGSSRRVGRLKNFNREVVLKVSFQGFLTSFLDILQTKFDLSTRGPSMNDTASESYHCDGDTSIRNCVLLRSVGSP